MKNIQQISIARLKAFSLARTIAEQLRAGHSLINQYDSPPYTVMTQKTIITPTCAQAHNSVYFLQTIMVTWNVHNKQYSLTLPTIIREEINA